MATRLRRACVIALACVAVGLGGCSSVLTEGTAAGAGIAGAAVSRAVTKNAGVTTGIGLGVQAAAHAGLLYAERRMHAMEQDEIAEVAGGLPVGGVAQWRIAYDVPIQPDEHGEVTVSRVYGAADFACKEIVFSVDQDANRGVQRDFYTTEICRDGTHWRWATAEPSTSRWGALQ